MAKANQAAFDIGQLADRLAQGYYMHTAAMEVATDPRVKAIGGKMVGGPVPVGHVARLDGTRHAFSFPHFLALASTNQAMMDDLARTWLVGSLLTVGDALSLHHYFDRAPELELLRHLRNGVAHGNRFRIDNPASLTKFPAHNRLAWIRSDTKAEFEISAALQHQPVLFQFMGPGDVLDLLMSVGIYLCRIGTGAPPRKS
jgi:hypothetical protein